MRSSFCALLFTTITSLLAGCASNPISNARYWTLDRCTNLPNANVRLQRRDNSLIAIVPKKNCQALASAAEKIQAQANFTVWRIYLADIEDRNAFATLDKEGRSIAVVSFGMLVALGSDEDAWAGLMGHELAHHVRRHSEGRQAAQSSAKTTGQVAANFLSYVIPGIGGVIAGTVGGTATQMAMYGAYTRPQEAEADQIGLEWMVQAGYDPQGMLRLFEALAKGNHSSGAPSFLSTHPANEERQAAVKTFIADRARSAVSK